ncbi:SDR family oxidoreductase [Roseateles amylovorans]|uniref:SDR family oxidoreductase n=1 Tax=Roseateles amylovorans TaxID=2978473 RepID=A0ABY6AYQ6_9BURK|nr:SDR family oxidoreductase [Roseateles amylovorans]UXH78314.1 SDR family oxidoreductase [Roseateles amylovorans]
MNSSASAPSAFQAQTVSVVIGGTSGIGRAVVQALQARPGQVIAAGRRTALDVSKEADVATFFESLGPIDHVVFTAGSSAPGGALIDLDLTAARAAFDTKFWGAVHVARHAARRMRPGGTLTLTSGMLARRPTPGTFVKSAMNAALEITTKVLARELAPLRVNAVSPGLTDTEAYAGMAPAAREAMLAKAAASLPAGRVGRPEDLAAAVLFAIDNPFVTGTVIDVEGGALIQ